METASPTATTPRSTHSNEPFTASTPAVGRAEDPILSEDLGFEASVEFDQSMEDNNERECVEDFKRSTCGCKLGPEGSPCSSFFNKRNYREV